MSFATVLVYVDLDGELDGRVQLAAEVAGRFRSRLIGLGAWMPRPAFVVEGVVVDPEPNVRQLGNMREALDRRGERFEAATHAEGRTIEWRSALDFPAEFLAREARAADLVVIGRDRTPYDPYRFPDAGALILRVGRPVLLVPPGVRGLAARRILVAWKDTREARRAVQDALPFLKSAAEVVILEASEFGREQDAQNRVRDVKAYLERHGVAAVAERVRPVDGTASNTLMRLVEEQSVDLIVAGAYGHSRLGEWMFGGVTQDLLTASPVCCLLSH